METNVFVVLALWAVVVMTFGRAARKGRLFDPSGRRIRMMFLLSILAFTFRGEAAEAALDRHFFDLPVAVYLKYVCLIWVCHLYSQMLREVGSISGRRVCLSVLAPIAIGLGLLSSIVYVVFRPLPAADLRLLVVGACDAVVLTFIACGLLSGTLSMRRRERVPAMRLKLAAIVLLFASFSIAALASMAETLMTLFHFGDAAFASRASQPFVFAAGFFFVLLLVPYRWYDRLLHLQDLYTYYRLRRLQRRVLRLTETHSDGCVMPDAVTQSGDLELAIYRSVIAILDAYPMIERAKEGRDAFSVVHDCVIQNPEYADLVSALAGVRL